MHNDRKARARKGYIQKLERVRDQENLQGLIKHITSGKPANTFRKKTLGDIEREMERRHDEALASVQVSQYKIRHRYK